MITDEMLQKAAAQAAITINDSLPAPEECRHTFSPQFEHRMQKLTKRANHPLFYKSMKMAAGFALAFLIGFGSLFSLSAEVRAAVFGWFRSVYDSSCEYEFEGDPSGIGTAEYQLQWVPEGYTLTSRETIAGNTDAWYENEAGKQILFSYTAATNDTGLYINTEEGIHHTADLGGNLADIYLDKDLNGRHVIVWIDAKTDTLLFINGWLSEEELLRMAESVVIE